jgi:hypothetical protein
MKSKVFEWTAHSIAVLVLASIAALAQNGAPKRFSGVINAYTPQTTSTTGTVVGPYEVRGPWSLTFKKDSGKAEFSAALNMELSDGWVITENGSDFDPAARGAHTHHITMCGDVTKTSTGGLQITGPATITLNGSAAPVSPSVITVEITGGTDVKFSNITLTFASPGSNHFGAEPLPGVVRLTERW